MTGACTVGQLAAITLLESYLDGNELNRRRAYHEVPTHLLVVGLVKLAEAMTRSAAAAQGVDPADVLGWQRIAVMAINEGVL